MSADKASLINDIIPALKDHTGWTIDVDGNVSDEEITASAGSTGWYSAFVSILANKSLCWSTNTETHHIQISRC